LPHKQTSDLAMTVTLKNIDEQNRWKMAGDLMGLQPYLAKKAPIFYSDEDRKDKQLITEVPDRLIFDTRLQIYYCQLFKLFKAISFHL